MKIKPRKTSRLAILLSVFVLSSVMNMQSKSVNITMQTSSQEVNNIIEKKGKPIIERFQTTRFIVKYKNDDGLTQLKEEIKDKVKSSKEIKDKYFSIVNTEQRMKVSDLMDEIKQKKLDSNIEYIQPDYPLTLSSNDTYFDKQWGVYNDKTVIATDIIGKEQSIKFDINAVDAWKYSQGKDTVIAVLDTGIDINHEDLTANIFVNDKEIPGNGVDDDGNGYIDDVNGWNLLMITIRFMIKIKQMMNYMEHMLQA
jgi:subtilisin family serine protease